jgi:uncharacterized membrane protein
MAGGLVQDKVDTIVSLAEQIARTSPQSADTARRIASLVRELEGGTARAEAAPPRAEAAPPRPEPVQATTADPYESYGRMEPPPVRTVYPRLHVLTGPTGSLAHPVVHDIRVADLRFVLVKGLEDFWAMPTHLVFLCLIYPVVGVMLASFAFGYNVLSLLYPLAAGFALLGPFAGIGLYELSRRREQGLSTEWKDAFEVLKSPAMASIAALGVVLLVIFLTWLLAATEIYRWLYGYRTVESLPGFVAEALTTSRGWAMILVGNVIGAVFAVVVLAISVISFPLLLDQDVGVVCAVQTSIKAVVINPVTMALWGMIVAALLVIGSLPLFVGLAIVMPLLGHATWHLYRRVIEPDPEKAHPVA